MDPIQLKSKQDYIFSSCSKVYHIFQRLSAIAVPKEKNIEKLDFFVGVSWM